MNKQGPRNIPASIHQCLLNIAKDTSRPFDEVLQYFAMERFLYRLGLSQHAESFVLKGALVFRIWHGLDSRATRDIDFLAYMDNTPELLAEVIRDTCGIEFPDDGLVFDAASVKAQPIKKDANYEGVRVRFLGYLGKARIVMQIDVGFGDTIHPEAAEAKYPTLLDLPASSIRTYPPESVIAEKCEAMVQLGGLNSRMKDFYDIWRMSRQFDFEGPLLSEAIKRTFNNRDTPIVLFEEIAAELTNTESIEKQWQAFLAKSQLEAPSSFEETLLSISDFLSPVFAAVKNQQSPLDKWTAGKSWASN